VVRAADQGQRHDEGERCAQSHHVPPRQRSCSSRRSVSTARRDDASRAVVASEPASRQGGQMNVTVQQG
jgi:hypothetical protein